jgi:transposase
VLRRIFATVARAGGAPAEVLLDASYAKIDRSALGGNRSASRRKGLRQNWGEPAQAIGWSRDGRTTRIHAAAKRDGNSIAFHPPGEGGEPLRRRGADRACSLGRKGDRGSRLLEACGAVANIPPRASERWNSSFNAVLARHRNAIERMFCRLKDFRRVVT